MTLGDRRRFPHFRCGTAQGHTAGEGERQDCTHLICPRHGTHTALLEQRVLWRRCPWNAERRGGGELVLQWLLGDSEFPLALPLLR